MEYSRLGDKFSDKIGIVDLMDDLGKALVEDADMIMMGGGNPSHIPRVQECIQSEINSLLQDSTRFNKMIGDYDGPKGHLAFRKALAKLFREDFNWQVSEHNIALTHGSQSAFFSLFNLFGGTNSKGKFKKVLFPLTPEYIGYGDSSLEENFFQSCKPSIEYIDDHCFKYHVDFEQLKVDDSIAALCVSRPTNPTGNVITDEELEKLLRIAQKQDIPLIIDNAYGNPFPGIIFNEVSCPWNEQIIMCLSLSKLGLPGTRTGIVVAQEGIIERLASMNSVMSLAPGSFGPELALNLVESKKILKISREMVRPYYAQKVQKAQAMLSKYLRDDIPWYVHKAEGALFLWLWFKDLPISCYELYERLKEKNVLLVPGNYFFPGLEEDWAHKQECLRMTYSSKEEDVEQGIKIIAEEVNKLYAK